MFQLLTALSLAACSEGEGDPCQTKADCSSGLLCCSARSAARGTCMDVPMCDANPDEDEAGRGGSSAAGRGGSASAGRSGSSSAGRGGNPSEPMMSEEDGGT
jgi:hypothetical protein